MATPKPLGLLARLVAGDPMVFSWSSAHRPAGWYGLGSAWSYEKVHGEGSLDRIAELYHDWPFLTSAFDNAELILGRSEPRIASLYAGSRR